MASPRKRCSRCKRNRQARFFVSERGRVCLDCQRKRTTYRGRGVRLQETYGITLEEYAALLAHQGGVCAGCGGTRRYNLHVDHDHKVEHELGSRASVRGLLCANCNGVLRKVRDNPDTLLGLHGYLLNPPAKEVLK